MNKKLTIEHLAPYLPYGLKILDKDSTNERHVYYLEPDLLDLCIQEQDFPLLRPLSQLTQEIEHEGRKFVPQEILSHLDLEWLITSRDLIMKTNYEDVLKLLSWYFDVFGLIESGLAIEIPNNAK